jgi:hypothetical protein
MEMMQDCTHIRQLEGEQRLLSWGMEKADKDGYHEHAEVREATKTNDETGYISKTKNNVETGDEDIATNGSPRKWTLSGDTKLKTLLQQFSGLKDDLIAFNPKFSILNSPMAKVILPLATIKMMSEQSGIPRQELIDKINELIAAY